MDLQKLKQLTSKGRIFSAKVKTKEHPEGRQFVARRKVAKGVTGVGMKFDPEVRGLLNVWDFVAGGFRFVAVDNIIDLKVDGVVYIKEGVEYNYDEAK